MIHIPARNVGQKSFCQIRAKIYPPSMGNQANPGVLEDEADFWFLSFQSLSSSFSLQWLLSLPRALSDFHIQVQKQGAILTSGEYILQLSQPGFPLQQHRFRHPKSRSQPLPQTPLLLQLPPILTLFFGEFEDEMGVFLDLICCGKKYDHNADYLLNNRLITNK